MALEIAPLISLGIEPSLRAPRIPETLLPLQVVLPRNKIQELREFSGSMKAVEIVLLDTIGELHSLRESKTFLPPEIYQDIEMDQIKIIQELRAMVAAKETIAALGEDKEVILAPWNAENVTTIVKAPFYYMTLNDYGTQVFLELIFQEHAEESLRQTITRTLFENEKVVIKSKDCHSNGRKD